MAGLIVFQKFGDGSLLINMLIEYVNRIYVKIFNPKKDNTQKIYKPSGLVCEGVIYMYVWAFV